MRYNSWMKTELEQPQRRIDIKPGKIIGREFPPRHRYTPAIRERTTNIMNFFQKSIVDEDQAPWDRDYSREEVLQIGEDLKPTILSYFSALQYFKEDNKTFEQAQNRTEELYKQMVFGAYAKVATGDDDLAFLASQALLAGGISILSRSYPKDPDKWRGYIHNPSKIPEGIPRFTTLIMATTSECITWEALAPTTDYKDYPNPFYDKYRIFNAGAFAQGFQTLEDGTDCYVVQFKNRAESEAGYMEAVYPIAKIEEKLGNQNNEAVAV